MIRMSKITAEHFGCCTGLLQPRGEVSQCVCVISALPVSEEALRLVMRCVAVLRERARQNRYGIGICPGGQSMSGWIKHGVDASFNKLRVQP